MTNLREQMIDAIHAAIERSRPEAEDAANAALCVLATWEPSDEVCQVLAAYTVEKGNPEKLWLAKHVIEKILRAMAEDAQ